MKNLGLAYLNGKSIKSISRVSLSENETEYLHLDDTFILQTTNGSLIQILIDYKIFVYKLESEQEIIILGEYDLPNCKITIENIYESQQPQTINSIYSYTYGESYNFGSKFLNALGNFIFGFCYGFDELILIDKSEFNTLIQKSYNHITEKLI